MIKRIVYLSFLLGILVFLIIVLMDNGTLPYGETVISAFDNWFGIVLIASVPVALYHIALTFYCLFSRKWKYLAMSVLSGFISAFCFLLFLGWFGGRM